MKKKAISKIGLAGVVLVATCAGQQQPSIKQESKGGSCSNIVALAGNVTINCASLNSAERKLVEKIPSVLNKILAHQLDPDAVMLKLDEILNAVADRRLTEHQKTSLLASLSPYRGSTINIVSVLGDKEGKRFAQDFVEVFRKAGWTGLDGSGHDEANYNIDPIGVVIDASRADAASNALTKEFGVVWQALTAAGIPFAGSDNGQIAAATFKLRIGVKPTGH